MSPLQSRKKMLVAESELNRAQLVQDWEQMTDEAHALVRKARTISSFASAATALMAGLTLFCRKKSVAVEEKSSWLKTILKGAGLVSTILTAFRPHRDNDES